MPNLSNVSRALVWMRRDLRLDDHHALSQAVKKFDEVLCVFVFDTSILSELPKQDRRIEFIWEALRQLHERLNQQGSGLLVVHDDPIRAIPAICQALGAQAVYCNHDDEPYARSRDATVQRALLAHNCQWLSFKDHVIFERSEILTAAGQPFSVFTPYKNAWLRTLQKSHYLSHPITHEKRFVSAVTLQSVLQRVQPMRAWLGAPSRLEEIGFAKTNLSDLAIGTGSQGARNSLVDFAGRMQRYHETRDFPALRGPSYLSVHLRFGTISIRELVRLAVDLQTGMPDDNEGARVWLSELIWRDFYHQILYHHPRVVGQSFKVAYDRIEWETDEELFSAWCAGRTGYPLVDAAMAQLNQTGYMHNRLRMVVASFLTKDLGIDWRKGEAYFALHLNDYDLAANNGGWQWAASSGCDAQPYFRIFNPVTQSEKFDAKGLFIRRYLPQLAALDDKAIHAPWQADPLQLKAAGVVLGSTYPRPVVDHAAARQRTLLRYTVVKSED